MHVPEDKIKSKGIKSVRSRVTNLRPYLAKEYQDIDVPTFRDDLIKGLFHVDSLDEIKDKEYVVTPEDQAEIDKIYEEYYNNWDWVYGKSPEFTLKRRKHFDMGTIDARFDIKDGVIKNVKFYGDFFGPQDVSELSNQLKGVKYDREAIAKVLNEAGTQQYITGIPTEQIIDLLV